MTDQQKDAARRAIERAGGPRAMAEKLNRLGATTTVHCVRRWKDNGVPAKFALWAEYLSGVPLAELRPDMDPRA